MASASFLRMKAVSPVTGAAPCGRRKSLTACDSLSVFAHPPSLSRIGCGVPAGAHYAQSAVVPDVL